MEFPGDHGGKGNLVGLNIFPNRTASFKRLVECILHALFASEQCFIRICRPQ